MIISVSGGQRRRHGKRLDRRVHVQFKPKPAQILNQVEVWFNVVTAKVLKATGFRSLTHLVL